MAYFHTTVLDNQIKALPTVSTASGSVATFDTDMTENLVEVKCQIVAKQASGTPTPNNPLPITTYTEMNVSACGKNFYKSGTVTEDFNGTFWSLGGALGSNVPDGSLILNAGTYTLSNFPTKEIRRFDETGARVDTAIGTMTFTLTKREKVRFAIVTNSQNYNVQIELGNTATAYNPYQGTTSNIPFGQTVANGVINVTTGKLVITHSAVDLGSFTWEKTTAERMRTLESISGAKIPITTETFNGACSWYKTANNEDVYYHTVSNSIAIQPSGLVVVYDTNYNSYADGNAYKTAVTGQTLVFELATPIEIQLDSITLQALLNENNIWCDTGDTEVKFLLTVGKKIA